LEATAALARLEKAGRISSREFTEALAELDVFWAEIAIHSATDDMIQAASKAAIDHRLRAYDSLHLTTAQALTEVAGPVTFACWDRELRVAAHDCGLTLMPEQL
jgi:predicted nucleic acid-binding protein